MSWTNLPLVIAGVVLIAVAAFVTLQVVSASSLPEGPVEPVWDLEACAHCQMHVGEPAFAAQLQTTAGDILGFDDPGCAFRFIAASQPSIHALYFHHHREDRWVHADGAGFVDVTPTPMGFGLGAVDAETPGAQPLEAARARCLAPQEAIR